MESSTKILRRMLDERDEYYKTSGNKTWWGRPIDRQTGKPINVFHYQAQPMGEDRLFVELQLATPEQAIAATLGSCNCTNDCTNGERTETCHADETEHIDISWQDGRHLTIHVMECSECGHTYEHVNGDYEFCPHCGRRVVEVNA